MAEAPTPIPCVRTRALAASQALMKMCKGNVRAAARTLLECAAPVRGSGGGSGRASDGEDEAQRGGHVRHGAAGGEGADEERALHGNGRLPAMAAGTIYRPNSFMSGYMQVRGEGSRARGQKRLNASSRHG